MELSQLRYFKLLAEIENLTQASKKLYISTPALHENIKKLENEVGYTLFDRSLGKPLKLNKRGKVLLDACEDIFGILDKTVQDIRDINDDLLTDINIATTSPMLFHDCFIAFKNLYPKTSLRHTIVSLPDIQDLDVIKKYDFIITASGDMATNIIDEMFAESLYHNDFPMLIVYPEHAFTRRKYVDVEELSEEFFVAVSKNLSSRKMFDEVFSIAGITPKIIFETDYYARDRIILDGQGIGLSTYQVKLACKKSKLVFIPIRNLKFRRQHLIFWFKRKQLSAIAEEFKKFIVEYYREFDLPDDYDFLNNGKCAEHFNSAHKKLDT